MSHTIIIHIDGSADVMNFKLKFKKIIFNLNNASLFIYGGHPLHYASHLLLLLLLLLSLLSFIYSSFSRVFVTYWNLTIFNSTFTQGFTNLLSYF